jgi:hypothetical protein
LKVLAENRAVDRGDLALLITLLDLSAARDTVDHMTLLRRLEVSSGAGSVSKLGVQIRPPEAVDFCENVLQILASGDTAELLLLYIFE